MSTNSNSNHPSRKITGFLWILAALLMGLPPLFTGGNKSLVAIGVMFLIFGLVSLKTANSTEPE